MITPSLLALFNLILPSSTLAASAQTLLAQSALEQILQRGSPILGFDAGCNSTSPTCDWMAEIPDDTKLVHMNLPGTHDSSTWNYTQARQDELMGFTGTDIPEARFFQCQEHSLFQMLNGGIRVFDLRFAWNPGNLTVGFYHSQALLAPTTRMEDVFFGFYSWLDQHPTEAVLISLNHESGTGTVYDEALQETVYEIFNTELARRYWVQVNGSLGTLGEARGKLTLLQRFDYSLLPAEMENRIGIHLDPEHWTDNDPNITLVYNQAQADAEGEGSGVAYIEDYYEIGTPTGSGAALNIQWKLNATIAHIAEAGEEGVHPEGFYISFASSEHNEDVPPEYPRIMALGNGTTPGVNQRLLQWLEGRKGEGKRVGVVMLDFFDSVPGLVEAIIGL